MNDTRPVGGYLPQDPAIKPDLTIRDAAARIPCDARTVRRWISEGRLTAWRIGPRMLRVSSVELDSIATQVPSAETERSTC